MLSKRGGEPGPAGLGADPAAAARALDHVRDVLVIGSSSRSGSTLLAEIFRRCPAYLQISGEINPFLRLAGLTWPAPGTDSDALQPEQITADSIGRFRVELAREIGIPHWESPAALSERSFVERLHRRLCMQWPLEEISFGEVAEAAAYAAHTLEQHSGDAQSCVSRFHALLLIQLRKRVPAINPYYYDIDRALIAALGPKIPTPAGPPSARIVEEPPFVLTTPMRQPEPEDFRQRALVIKTPSNAYRLEFLRELFPTARFRILHLTRNPAAAINGLYDGWCHWGFHSHRIGEELRIAGFNPPHAADRAWWKFDLPPGWRQYCEATLEEVCAFQWRSAHQAIDQYIQQTGIESHRLRFEDLLTGFARRPALRGVLNRWLGAEVIRDDVPDSLPTTMATRPPKPRRWLERAEIIRAVVETPATWRCVERLDYRDETWWI